MRKKLTSNQTTTESFMHSNGVYNARVEMQCETLAYKQTGGGKKFCHHWQSRGKSGSTGLKKQTERKQKQTKKQAPLA